MMFARKYRSEILIAIATLAIAAAWLPIRMRFPFDDTYITFRYAANIAHGFGIVWNPGGAHTEGYTNFLFMLMLVSFSWMGCDLVVVSQAIGVVAVVVSAITIYRLVAHTLVCYSAAGSQTKVCATFAVALFLLDPFIWFNAYSGMETSLFTMWLLLTVLSAKCLVLINGTKNSALSTQRLTLSFIFATLAALTRPEGAIIGGVVFLVAFWGQTTEGTQGTFGDLWRVAKPALSFFVFPLMVYGLWKLWYFGDVLPNSFYVKVGQVSGGTFLPGRGTIRIFYESVWYLVPFAIIGVWKNRNNAVIRIMAAWCIALSVFYLFSALIQPQYGRFTNSIEVMLIVLAATGIASWKNIRPSIIFAIAGLLVFLNMIWPLYFRGGLGAITQDTEYVETYRELASVLRLIPGHENITFAWSDAGILPYYSGMRNLDMVGLNTNEIARAGSTGEVVRIIARARPDIFIIPLDNDTVHGLAGQIFRGGHGLIGSGFSMLLVQPELKSYKPVAVIPVVTYDLEIFADTLSPHYRDIVNTLAPRIGHDANFLPTVNGIRGF